jgi:hypothetical protein
MGSVDDTIASWLTRCNESVFVWFMLLVCVWIGII